MTTTSNETFSSEIETAISEYILKFRAVLERKGYDNSEQDLIVHEIEDSIRTQLADSKEKSVKTLQAILEKMDPPTEYSNKGTSLKKTQTRPSSDKSLKTLVVLSLFLSLALHLVPWLNVTHTNSAKGILVGKFDPETHDTKPANEKFDDFDYSFTKLETPFGLEIKPGQITFATLAFGLAASLLIVLAKTERSYLLLIQKGSCVCILLTFAWAFFAIQQFDKKSISSDTSTIKEAQANDPYKGSRGYSNEANPLDLITITTINRENTRPHLGFYASFFMAIIGSVLGFGLRSAQKSDENSSRVLAAEEHYPSETSTG
jgi:hypothetical protein